MIPEKADLRVLFLEDSKQDIEIVHQKLLDDFHCPVFLDSAATEEDYVHCIQSKDYDVILADYTLPAFNAEEALKLALSICPTVPFICVSGTIGEDIAVELLKQGAADYVLKDRLGRLSFAISRAISDRLRIVKEEALTESEAIKGYLLKFNDAIRDIKDPEQIQLIACRILGDHIGASRVLYGDVIGEKEVVIGGQYVKDNPSITSRLNVSDFIDAHKSGNPLVFNDISSDPRLSEDNRRAFKSIQSAANISVGLLEDGVWIAAFSAHKSEPRLWTTLEIILVEETAQRTWAAVERAKAEAALHESKEKFRIAQELSPDGFSILRPVRDACGEIIDFTWIYENSAIAKLNGTDPKAVIGRRLLELFPGCQETSFLRSYKKVVETGETLVLEDKYEYESETMLGPIWFRKVVVQMNGDIVILAQNITERKQVEEKLRESEERFRAIQENSLDRFTILKPFYDGQGDIVDFTFVYQNAQAAKTAGCRPEEVIGLRMTEIWPTFPQTRFFEVYKETVKTGQAAEFEEIYNSDGVDDWFHATVTPVPGGIAIATQVVTERKLSEEKLRESEARFRSVLDNSIDIIYRANVQTGCFEYISPSAETVMGYTPEQYMAMSPEEAFAMIHPDDLPAMRQAMARINEMGSVEAVYRQRTKNGEYRWVSNNMSLTRDSNGLPLYRNCNLRDITERKQVEEALAEERQRLYDVLEKLPAMVCLLAPDYRVPFANQAFVRKFGGPNGRRCYEFCMREDKPCESCESLKPLETGKPHNWEKHLPDGSVIDVYDHLFTDIDGSPLILEMDIDITERKRAEEALAEERQRLYDVLEKLPAMVCLLAPDYRVPFANQAFLKKFSEPKGRRCYEFCMEKDKPCESCQSFKPFETGQPHNWENILPDGSVIDVYDHLFTDIDGSQMILEMDIDITERKRTEEALSESKQKIQSVLAGMTDAYYFYDQDWRFVDINQKALGYYGKSRQEMIGQNVWELYPHTVGSKTWREYQRAVSEGVPVHFETQSGVSEHFFEVHAYPESKGLAVYLKEITERKRFEFERERLVNELKQADKDKNQFISVLSHELRNPLASISAGLQLLEITQDQNKIYKAKEIMLRQMEQLCKLVDDLLDVTRMTQQKIILKKELTNMNRLVKNAVEDLKSEFNKKGVKLETRIQTLPITLDADAGRLSQIIGNILYNALKFTPKDGVVRLSLKQVNNQAIIKVKDNGKGISPDIQPHLFKPFTQAEQTIDRRNGGLGLGLSIAKGIAEQHGGSVSAFSFGVGKGSEFTICLPIFEAQNRGE